MKRYIALLFCLLLIANPILADRQWINPMTFDSDNRVSVGSSWDTLFPSGTGYIGTSRIIRVDTLCNDLVSWMPVGDTIIDTAWAIECDGDCYQFESKYNDPLYNIILFMVNDSLLYGSDGSDGNTGIGIGSGNEGSLGNLNNFKIFGGYNYYSSFLLGNDGNKIYPGVYHNQPVGDTDQFNNISIAFTNQVHDIEIRGVNTYSAGFSWETQDGNDTLGAPQSPVVVGAGISPNIQAGGDESWNISIIGGEHISGITSYFNRCYYQGAAIRLINFQEYADDSTGYLFDAKFDSAIVQSHHIGVLARGYAVGGQRAEFIIRADSIIVDKRSDTLNTQHNVGSLPGGGSVCVGTANAYGILAVLTKDIIIEDNVILFDSSFGGGRGISIESANSVDKRISVRRNKTISSEGPDPYYGEDLETQGLRVRYATGGAARFRDITDNEIIVITDNDPSTAFRTYGGTALRYSGGTSPANDSIVRNKFICFSPDSNGTNHAVMIENYGNSVGTIWKHNRLESDGVAWRIGEYNLAADTGTHSIEDTIVRIDIGGTFYSVYLGYGSSNVYAVDFKIENATYLNGADDSDIFISNDDQALREVSFYSDFILYVAGNNNIPVVNAAVKGWTIYSDSSQENEAIFSDNTNGGGKISIDTLIYYKAYQITSESDSTFYPYRIRVISPDASDTSWFRFNVGWEDSLRTDTLTASYVGDGDWNYSPIKFVRGWRK